MLGVFTGVQPNGDGAHRGIVTAVEEDDAWGRRLSVELDDGRTVHAQPWYLGTGARGVFPDIKAGDVCLAIPVNGNARDWIALVGGCFESSSPPNEVRNSTATLLYGPAVEARSAGGEQVQGVVVRQFLNDLSATVGDAIDALTPVATSTPPTDVASLIAFCGKVTAAAVAVNVALSTLKTKLDQATAAQSGKGGAPFCSPVLRGAP